MANVFSNKFKENLWSKSNTNAIDIPSDTIKVGLLDSGVYTPVATDQFYSACSSAIIGTPQALASKTITNGVFDAADVTFTTVTGASVEYLVLFKDTGTPSTSPIIAFIDQVSSGLPVTPNGGNINVVWNASGILAFV